MKKLIYLFPLVMLVSGCAGILPESPGMIRLREGASYSQRVFFPIYNSDLSVWVGKTLEDVAVAFEGNIGERTIDVYGNGYAVYSNFPVEGFRTRYLTFYVKGNKIYNVVKE